MRKKGRNNEGESGWNMTKRRTRSFMKKKGEWFFEGWEWWRKSSAATDLKEKRKSGRDGRKKITIRMRKERKTKEKKNKENEEEEGGWGEGRCAWRRVTGWEVKWSEKWIIKKGENRRREEMREEGQEGREKEGADARRQGRCAGRRVTRWEVRELDQKIRRRKRKGEKGRAVRC